MSVTCSNGHENLDGMTFCEDCGVELTSITNTPPPAVCPGSAGLAAHSGTATGGCSRAPDPVSVQPTAVRRDGADGGALAGPDTRTERVTER